MRWVCYGYFVDLQLPTTVRSSYLSKLCGSMSVLSVHGMVTYVPNYSCYAGQETCGNMGRAPVAVRALACADSNRSTGVRIRTVEN